MPVTPDLLAERLKSAIKSSGLSQQSVASEAGLDPTALSKVLSGRRRVSSLELARLADVLAVPVSQLLSEGDASKARVAARVQPEASPAISEALARVDELLEVDGLLTELGRGPSPAPLPLKVSAGSPIEEADELAIEVRRLTDIGDAEIPELASFCERELSIDVAVEPLPSGLDGLSVSRGDYRLALISSSIPATRQRYTLAHEIGHLAAGDADDTVKVDVNLFGERSPIETRANSFAASFLMPESSLRRSLGSSGPTESAIGDMLVRYKVSLDALAYRLHNVGLVNAGGRDRVRSMSVRALSLLSGRGTEYHRQLQGMGYRRLPEGLLSRALDAYQHGEISVRVLSRLSRLSEEMLLEQFEPLPARSVSDDTIDDEVLVL